MPCKGLKPQVLILLFCCCMFGKGEDKTSTLEMSGQNLRPEHGDSLSKLNSSPLSQFCKAADSCTPRYCNYGCIEQSSWLRQTTGTRRVSPISPSIGSCGQDPLLPAGLRGVYLPRSHPHLAGEGWMLSSLLQNREALQQLSGR